MFAQSPFGQLVLAQDSGDGEVFHAAWAIQCKSNVEWLYQPKDELGVLPCQ